MEKIDFFISLIHILNPEYQPAHWILAYVCALFIAANKFNDNHNDNDLGIRATAGLAPADIIHYVGCWGTEFPVRRWAFFIAATIIPDELQYQRFLSKAKSFIMSTMAREVQSVSSCLGIWQDFMISTGANVNFMK